MKPLRNKTASKTFPKQDKSDVDLDRVDPDFDNIKEDTTEAVQEVATYDHYGD